MNRRERSRLRGRSHLGMWIVGIMAYGAGCSGDAAAPGAAASADNGNAAVASAATEPVVHDYSPEEGFRLLTLADFEQFPANADTWSERGGLLVCSGKPKGYAYTREEFGNFTLRCEYRFVPPAPPPDAAAADKFNTGFMIHIREPHKVWPASLEVQGRFDEMGAIKSNGGVPALTIVDDPDARKGVRLPVGQWNAIEIVSRDGELSATLNGLRVCSSHAGELRSGRLGLQSEGFEVEFKHLRVKVVK